MSRLALLNFCLLQWLSLRLAIEVDMSGAVVARGLIGPLLPLTGWWSPYIGRHRFIIKWRAHG